MTDPRTVNRISYLLEGSPRGSWQANPELVTFGPIQPPVHPMPTDARQITDVLGGADSAADSVDDEDDPDHRP